MLNFLCEIVMLIDFVFALTLLISLLSLTILIFKGMNCAPSSTLMFLLACFLFVTEANFRNRELDDSSIDFQIFKIGIGKYFVFIHL